jgi:hypothetical protein
MLPELNVVLQPTACSNGLKIYVYGVCLCIYPQKLNKFVEGCVRRFEKISKSEEHVNSNVYILLAKDNIYFLTSLIPNMLPGENSVYQN